MTFRMRSRDVVHLTAMVIGGVQYFVCAFVGLLEIIREKEETVVSL